MANPPTDITLRPPSKYSPSPTAHFTSPPLEWLHRTWSVTHSTLSMWRTARNVRITYAPLPADAKTGAARIDDLVEYEKAGGKAKAKVKSVEGVDTAGADGWDWRGKGWLFFVRSHWELLGWGERPLAGGAGVERWAVTWFAPTLFTKEGVDVYSDRPEGCSPETVEAIMAALRGMDGAGGVVSMVEKDMREVEVQLPWEER